MGCRPGLYADSPRVSTASGFSSGGRRRTVGHSRRLPLLYGPRTTRFYDSGRETGGRVGGTTGSVRAVGGAQSSLERAGEESASGLPFTLERPGRSPPWARASARARRLASGLSATAGGGRGFGPPATMHRESFPPHPGLRSLCRFARLNLTWANRTCVRSRGWMLAGLPVRDSFESTSGACA
jgi:hypothetical protein